MGKIIRKIDRFYPSSKTCCKCGIVKEELSLKERLFECECGHELGRFKCCYQYSNPKGIYGGTRRSNSRAWPLASVAFNP